MVLTKETSLFQQNAIQNALDEKQAIYTLTYSGSSLTYAQILANTRANSYSWAVSDTTGVRIGGMVRLAVVPSDSRTSGVKIYVSGIVDAIGNGSVTLVSQGLESTIIDGGSIITGTLSAISSSMGILETGVIKHEIVGGTDGIWFSANADTDSNITIGDSIPRKDWRLLVNNKFGVTKDGILYASGAYINGTVTISGHSDTIATEMANLQTATSNADTKATNADTKATDAATKATNYLTTLSGVDGLVVRKDVNSNSDYVNIQSNTIRMVTGGTEAFKAWAENNTTSVRVGATNTWNMLMGNNEIKFMRPNGYSAGYINFNSYYGRMFVGNSALAAVGDGSAYLGGIAPSATEVNITAEHRDASNNFLSWSRMTCMKGSIDLTVSNEDTPWTYPQYTGTTPSASILINSLSMPDYYYININAPYEINLSSPNIRFKPLGQSSATQFGSQNHIYVQYIPSGTSGYYIMKNSDGYLTIGSSSSKRYKHDILPIASQELDPHQLYNIEVVQFIYNDDHIEQTDQRFRKKIPGFIAEDVYKYYPIAVDLKEGRPEDWNHRFILPPMLKLIQEQHQEIEELKAKISILEEKIL